MAKSDTFDDLLKEEVRIAKHMKACVVCSHPDRESIDAALENRTTPLTAIARVLQKQGYKADNGVQAVVFNIRRHRDLHMK